jgi:hypothetical protein
MKRKVGSDKVPNVGAWTLMPSLGQVPSTNHPFKYILKPFQALIILLGIAYLFIQNVAQQRD